MSENLNEIEKARKLLAKEEEEKQEAFIKEINEVCKKHGFELNSKIFPKRMS